MYMPLIFIPFGGPQARPSVFSVAFFLTERKAKTVLQPKPANHRSLDSAALRSR